MTVRIAVLASGGGTNLQALIDACRSGSLVCEIACVVSDQPAAGAIERAQRAGIAVAVIERQRDETRNAYDSRLAEHIQKCDVDLVVLAGFMRLLSMSFLRHFPMRVMNLHPALPDEFPGVQAIERAFAEKDAGRTYSGVMVHFVPDEGVDDGPVIATVQVPLHVTDSFEQFSQRMHDAEHVLLVTAVQTVIADIENTNSYIHTPKEVSP